MVAAADRRYASTACLSAQEYSAGNANVCCALLPRLPYIQREGEKATGWKAGGDLQLCAKTLHSDVLGEGGRKEPTR